MAKIVTLKDPSTQESYYPRTVSEAVQFSESSTLKDRLSGRSFINYGNSLELSAYLPAGDSLRVAFVPNEMIKTFRYGKAKHLYDRYFPLKGIDLGPSTGDPMGIDIASVLSNFINFNNAAPTKKVVQASDIWGGFNLGRIFWFKNKNLQIAPEEALNNTLCVYGEYEYHHNQHLFVSENCPGNLSRRGWPFTTNTDMPEPIGGKYYTVSWAKAALKFARGFKASENSISDMAVCSKALLLRIVAITESANADPGNQEDDLVQIFVFPKPITLK